MKQEILKNRVITLILDENHELSKGDFHQGALMLKNDDKNVVFAPSPNCMYQRASENPMFFQGKFLSSRIKKNGNYSVHAVVDGKTNYREARKQAHQEIDILFDKLAICKP